MLVLARKKGEQIVVGVQDLAILIRIVDIHGSQVRIGVSAPADVAVHREEVWNRGLSWQTPGEHVSGSTHPKRALSAEHDAGGGS